MHPIRTGFEWKTWRTVSDLLRRPEAAVFDALLQCLPYDNSSDDLSLFLFCTAQNDGTQIVKKLCRPFNVCSHHGLLQHARERDADPSPPYNGKIGIAKGLKITLCNRGEIRSTEIACRDEFVQLRIGRVVVRLLDSRFK